MRKFKCVETGAILLVTNEFTAKQFAKNSFYEEIEEPIKKSNKKDVEKDAE